jgi:hypothetical protein
MDPVLQVLVTSGKIDQFPGYEGAVVFHHGDGKRSAGRSRIFTGIKE